MMICLMSTGSSLVVEYMLGYSSVLVVWNPSSLDPSDGVFGCFDLAALLRLYVCFFTQRPINLSL